MFGPECIPKGIATQLCHRLSFNETISISRRLERETGIEPATNSLEGCDSTTELLPPARSLISMTTCYHPPQHQTQLPHSTHTKLVARGGFEPPKPLGRQIYSLLRLTAPQPRQSQPSSDVRLPPCRTLSASQYWYVNCRYLSTGWCSLQ